MTFESLSPVERGWFLGQIDEALAGNYNKDLHRALHGVAKNGDAYVLYSDDGTRRAVLKFVDEYVDFIVEEAEKLDMEQAPTALARTAATICCLVGMAAGLNAETEEGEDE